MAQPLPRYVNSLRPPSAVMEVDERRGKPPHKALPPDTPVGIAPHMAGLRTDSEFTAFMAEHKQTQTPVVVQFGSTWCQKCHEIFPTFYALSKRFDTCAYAVAQVDYMREHTKGIKYSPTFHIYRQGKLVDHVLGKDAQKLQDHLWMHSD